MISKKDFHTEYISVFNDNKKMLDVGDKCYFLFSNDIDYHIKMVFSGEIVWDKMSAWMTKTFVIKPIECLSSQAIQDKYLIHKPFTCQNKPESTYIRKTFNPFTSSDPSKWVNTYFRTNSFFVREYNQEGLNSIKQILLEYNNFVLKDLNQKIKELSEFNGY